MSSASAQPSKIGTYARSRSSIAAARTSELIFESEHTYSHRLADG